jgi:S1-C subfamily serine protease
MPVQGLWLEPTILWVRRGGGKLGITVSGHTSRHDEPGVKVTDLNPSGRCAQSGMLVGSAIMSVAGKPVKDHQSAIQMLEANSKGEPQETFEVVVREPSRQRHGPVVQSL